MVTRDSSPPRPRYASVSRESSRDLDTSFDTAAGFIDLIEDAAQPLRLYKVRNKDAASFKMKMRSCRIDLGVDFATFATNHWHFSDINREPFELLDVTAIARERLCRRAQFRNCPFVHAH